MEKQTVIATLRVELGFSNEMRGMISDSPELSDVSWADNGGDGFLAEFGGQWNNIFVDTANELYEKHFRDLGLTQEQSPRTILTDSRRGSWIMEAAITFACTIGSTYTILKGISELPKIADGLEETKERLRKDLLKRFSKQVAVRIEPTIGQLPQSPSGLSASSIAGSITVNCSIDARAVRGLTPDTMKSHSVHLSVGVSRSAVSIENLGESSIQHLNVGIFESFQQQSSWNFADAFSKTVPLLSGGQSLSIDVGDFVSAKTGKQLDLSSNQQLYIDCWVQDQYGIYLFNFCLQQVGEIVI